MGIWNTRSRGLWHDSSKGIVAPQSLVGKDFLISKIGSNFNTGDCNVAYNAKIPFGLFFEADPALYVNYPLNDTSKFPQPDPTLKMLDSYIYMGDGVTKRAIHFIVIDCSKTTDAFGNTFTTMWIVTVGKYLIEAMKKKYKLPVYLYMNKNPFAAAKDEIGQQALAIFCTNYGDGLSTYTKVAVGSDGFPADGTKVVLPYDSGKPWGFWLYNPLTEGMVTINSKDKAGFYSSINYVSSGTPVTPPVEPPIQPPVVVDLSSVEEKLANLETKLLAMETQVNKIIDLEQKINLTYDYLTAHIK
jgi:hypothetical protein